MSKKTKPPGKKPESNIVNTPYLKIVGIFKGNGNHGFLLSGGVLENQASKSRLLQELVGDTLLTVTNHKFSNHKVEGPVKGSPL